MSDGNADRWFNTSAFVAPPQYQFGNSGIGILDAPGSHILDTGLMKNFYFTEFEVHSVPVGDVQRSESCQPFGAGHDSGHADVRPHHQRRDGTPDATRTEVCLLGSIVGRVRISGPASLMRFLALCIFLGVFAVNAQNPPSSTPSKADRLRSLIAQAEAAEQQNHLDEAVALYEQILRIRPGWASAELNLGLVYHSRAEYSKAIQSLTNALAHNAGLHSALLFRGASYYHTGRYNEAVRDLKNYLRHRSSSSEALSYLANAQLAKNDPAEAALAYASLARVSNEPSAYFQLTDAYIRLPDSVMEAHRRGRRGLPAPHHSNRRLHGGRALRVPAIPN